MSAVRRCELPLRGAGARARICDAPATTTRTIDNVAFDTCNDCAATLDAAPPSPLLAPILAARGRDRARGHPRKKWIVVRLSQEETMRLDALRTHCPRTSRAQLLRGLALFAVPMAEKALDVAAPAPSTKGAA